VTEIRFDIDLDHPPERVWRALTDPRHFGEWFFRAEVDAADRNRLRLHPERIDGLGDLVDVEVIDAAAPSRFVTRWQGDELHVRVAITIIPVGDRSRLTFVQRGFLGRRGTLRRRVLRTTYGRLFTERLPWALDRIAGQEPTVLLALKPPANLRASRATAEGGFRGRRVRRFEVRGVSGDEPQSVPALSVRDAAAGPARAVAVVPVPALESGVAGLAVKGGATGRATVPSASAWLAAQPAGRRHRAVAVPYRRRGNTRSIRRFVAIRPIGDDPTRMLHAYGARRRLDVVSHSAGSPSRRMLARMLVELGVWARSIPGWTAERRGAAMAVSAAILLVMAVAGVVTDRMTGPPRAAPPQVGGAAEPPPGFAVVPGRQRDSTEPSRQASALAAPASPESPAGAAGPIVLTASYRTASTWIGGYQGEVTIRNGGNSDVDGWTSTVTLPLLGLTVASVHGARFRQNGRTVTFTPTVDTGTVSPHGQVRFDFSVDGVGEPTDCKIDGRSCAGVSG
jgi:uncharacterized protein YndB with AHSA1/START domain